MATVFKRLGASPIASIIHKEKTMLCHHRVMGPASRRAAFHLDAWKWRAIRYILSALLAPLARTLEYHWWRSIHNAADNFLWSANFLSVVQSKLGIGAVHQHRSNAIISRKRPASAKTTGWRGTLSESMYTLEPEGLLTVTGSMMPNSSGVRGKQEGSFQSRKSWSEERGNRIRKKAGLRACSGCHCGEDTGGQHLNTRSREQGCGGHMLTEQTAPLACHPSSPLWVTGVTEQVNLALKEFAAKWSSL